ncbi:hypothetical protein ACM01_13605 [Streptomyces viridochromogenes]|uniref:Secreted protein n=1 Tax=Streptomyces viridochromogenes TaxID=1938 RepID=A0A0J7ZGU8_STRVR|nr:hypothetical protein [Streptomyces viridochromogenes]KMS74637.1 hypothetical protein ACM01_13605 [Streptomyces viridochromogenes]KOG13202.1 hypothetical protein ADK35_33020 [Streptomyces viridochromogenes]KOG22952.1 hypothetical protein ADK36_10710 [Streptomyces viridochromogenes]
MKTRNVARTAAVVIGIGMLTATTPAFADQDVKAIWGQAYRTNADHGVAAVKDLADDDNEVYVQYTRSGHGSRIFTLWNKKGKGTTTYSGDGGTVTIKRVCRSISLASDYCVDR